jgi:hypothetical protein
MRLLTKGGQAKRFFCLRALHYCVLFRGWSYVGTSIGAVYWQTSFDWPMKGQCSPAVAESPVVPF